MFLFPGQLHTDRTANRARQQHRVGGGIVGAVTAVATGSLHPDHVDVGFRPLQQQREIGAQDVRILGAGPHPDLTVVKIRDRAGWADRSVHLVRPGIRPLHRLCRTGQRRLDVALVDQGPRCRRIGAQRRLDVSQIGKRRHRLPGQLELRRRLDRVFLALGDDADKIADPDDGDESWNIADRGFIDRNQAGADKSAGIDAGIGRTHDAAMKHAGHAYVMNIYKLAGRLGWKVRARYRLPDDAVGLRSLDRHFVGQLKADALAANQFAIADAAVMSTDQAVFDPEIFDRQLKPFRRAREQELPRLGGGFAKRYRRYLNRLAGDGRALIGN